MSYVFKEIAAERRFHVAKGRDAAHDDARTEEAWVDCLEIVIHRWLDVNRRRMWIKVASIAVAAVESIDRKAAPADAWNASAAHDVFSQIRISYVPALSMLVGATTRDDEFASEAAFRSMCAAHEIPPLAVDGAVARIRGEAAGRAKEGSTSS